MEQNYVTVTLCITVTVVSTAAARGDDYTSVTESDRTTGLLIPCIWPAGSR